MSSFLNSSSSSKPQGFSLGAEEQICMSLDDLIEHRKKASKLSSKAAVKKPSKPARAQAIAKASSVKRQDEMNKRRGMNVNTAATKNNSRKASNNAIANVKAKQRKKVHNAVRNKPQLRVTRQKLRAGGGKMVARPHSAPNSRASTTNMPIATKPEPKFKLPRGANMKITVNVQKVKPVNGLNVSTRPAVHQPRMSGVKYPQNKVINKPNNRNPNNNNQSRNARGNGNAIARNKPQPAASNGRKIRLL